ncbi:MAG: response regulator [Planctomycetota bacterium]
MKSPQTSVGDYKILVVDDESIMVDVITAHLNRAGLWNVYGTSDPHEVVSLLPRESPDLLLVDLSMPNMSGNELIQSVRRNPEMSQLPILVVTGNLDPAVHRRAISLGASAIITKPIKPEKLLQAVSEALSLTGQRSSV